MSLEAPKIPDDISIFEPPSPESLSAPSRARAPSPLADDLPASTSDEQILTEDEHFVNHKPVQECASSRSSISSLPASVIHTIPLTDNEDGLRTPSTPQTLDRMKSLPGPAYLSGFRHPSSVRALQLESEYADSDALSLKNSGRARRSPKISHFSTRSSGSIHASPTKRSSRPGTPQPRANSNCNLKKEFPLVLLHCTLLPPAVATQGPLASEEILEAVLPEEYRKRWRMLQNRVVKNHQVKQRGVLIPHPRDDYELLEERLLEALELERPKLRRGHYLGHEKNQDSDSGFESSSQNDSEENSDDEEQTEIGERCPDCGKAVSHKIEQEQKWEVKIFAANGLMKNGAWAAAWEQMEKVDVEVGVWMPENIRLEVEERLKALQAKEQAEALDEPAVEPKLKSRRKRSNTARVRHDERMREIYGEPQPRTQEEIDGLVDDEPSHIRSGQLGAETSIHEPELDSAKAQRVRVHAVPASNLVQEDFSSFARRHLQLIWNDQRNLAIVLLSMLVLLFSFQNANVGAPSPTQELGKANVSAQSQLQVTPPPTAEQPLPVLPTIFPKATQIPVTPDGAYGQDREPMDGGAESEPHTGYQQMITDMDQSAEDTRSDKFVEELQEAEVKDKEDEGFPTLNPGSEDSATESPTALDVVHVEVDMQSTPTPQNTFATRGHDDEVNSKTVGDQLSNAAEATQTVLDASTPEADVFDPTFEAEGGEIKPGRLNHDVEPVVVLQSNFRMEDGTTDIEVLT